MNASRRNTMEDVHVVCAPGTWGAPDKDMAYLAVYDGHGGENEVCVFYRKKGNVTVFFAVLHHEGQEFMVIAPTSVRITAWSSSGIDASDT
jgi:hypothetical protein